MSLYYTCWVTEWLGKGADIRHLGISGVCKKKGKGSVHKPCALVDGDVSHGGVASNGHSVLCTETNNSGSGWWMAGTRFVSVGVGGYR